MTKLRSLIKADDCVLAPGVYDCVSAKIAELSGFPAIAVSGNGVEASFLGKPDMGFANLSDMALVAGHIVDSVAIPVICDADTGYGGVTNVWHTVQTLEKAGVQGLHIEDQKDPKKCGGLPGRQVIDLEEMVGKIEAALAARTSPDLVIIARTDAKEQLGFDEVVRRLNRYLEAGADVAFAAEPFTSDEIRRLGAEVAGPLAICGGIGGWSGSHETRQTYAAWGVNLVIYPFTSQFPAIRAMLAFYRQMFEDQGVSAELASGAMVDFSWFNTFMGVDTWSALDREFGKGGS